MVLFGLLKQSAPGAIAAHAGSRNSGISCRPTRCGATHRLFEHPLQDAALGRHLHPIRGPPLHPSEVELNLTYSATSVWSWLHPIQHRNVLMSPRRHSSHHLVQQCHSCTLYPLCNFWGLPSAWHSGPHPSPIALPCPSYPQQLPEDAESESPQPPHIVMHSHVL